ncbi:uncharacterized protein K444DRAFT_539537 [Hyaloscypha bicolor E]|uniref:Uncharacterized protein n=1 Tax=Hyaloscypha bicolor E TaxID=1095630 RepID=A0A2J6SVS0_9HELO|nr:uncharacterized protein K444DRAFT_539537 [Hyaloscypha bicolor E]PMD54763.1 hypothetical protein K444DRAFT_539537 [Hyaloscypha bicolor E]
MSSLYDQSIPVMIKYLNNASKMLDKAATYADEKGMKHEDILTFRLRDDMRPLPYQIQSLSNTVKWYCVRVLQQPNTILEDNETTFAELQDRIKTTISRLESISPSTLDLAKIASEPIIMEIAKVGNFRFESGQTYLSEYAIPNFHFHLTTAYCILRHLGVPLGAFDYLGGVFHKV